MLFRSAGTVVESNSPEFKAGDEVLVTGYEIGERHWGGYTQLNRLKADWLIPRPEALSLKQTMIIGTAGLTAMLSVMALEAHGLTPDDQRELVVTGASGGVGSMAVAILGRLGYNVVASTGKPGAHDYLSQLGARGFIDRSELTPEAKRPLESERWAGAVDAVGGAIEDAAGAVAGAAGDVVDAIGDAASDVGDLAADAADKAGEILGKAATVAGDAATIAKRVAERLFDGMIDSWKAATEDPWDALKLAAFATVLSPVSLAMTAAEIGKATVEETEKKIDERNA